MDKVIEVVFDGTTFVPTVPVDLPTGTKASVELPDHANVAPGVLAGPPPAPMTAEEETEWEEMLVTIRAAESPWATVDEALAYSRGRPRPEPPEEAP